MKPIALATACAALVLLALPAAAATPPKFAASCPSGSEIASDGKGAVSIDGTRAALKSVSSTAWRAHLGAMTIDIGRDGAQIFASESPKGDICQVTSSSAAPNADGSVGGVPKSDIKACRKAVKKKTNNKDVTALDATSSEANNKVILGVGPDKAKWQCLVKNGKVSGEVMSLTDEGAL